MSSSLYQTNYMEEWALSAITSQHKNGAKSGVLYYLFIFNQKVRWNTEGNMPIWLPPTKNTYTHTQSNTKNNRNTNNTIVYRKKKYNTRSETNKYKQD